MESVLVNFVYAPPVGHAIEALHYSLGYHAADPSRRGLQPVEFFAHTVGGVRHSDERHAMG